MTFSPDDYRHRFSAWAASRAASVKGCRFRVEVGQSLLRSVGLAEVLGHEHRLPAAKTFDVKHREWRLAMIDCASQNHGLKMTHGVAAKLINVYFKSGFLSDECLRSDKVAAIHPPIDSLLLDELSRKNVGGFKGDWNKARKTRWSNLGSSEYEEVIQKIRVSLDGQPLWQIEEHWAGFQ